MFSVGDSRRVSAGTRHIFLAARVGSGPEPDIQLIEITAKKYAYSNSPIHVKIGTKVLLKITVTDHDHGFTIGTVPDGIKRSGRINSDL